jgi:hypothetical protein
VRTPPASPALETLLPALCRDSPDDRAFEIARARLATDAGRHAFVERARAIRVLGLTLARLERGGVLDALPREAADELRAQLSRIRRAVAAQELERARVVARLRAAGIDPVLLKGAALRATCYDAPEEREAADLDLLVPHDAWRGAYGALVAAGYGALDERVIAGYRDRHFHLRLEHPLGSVVEIHWALVEPDAPFGLDAAAMWRDAARVTRRTGAARIPLPEHLLLHLASQSANDGFAIFNRLVDVDRIIARHPALDWDRVLDDARRGGLVTAVSLTLELAGALLGAAIPEGTAERFRPPALTRWHIRLLHPERRVLAPRGPRNATIERLMQLWVARGRRSLLWRVRAVVGQRDDIAVRHARDSAPSAAPLDAAIATLKLGAYQASRYVAAAGAALRREPTSARPWDARRPPSAPPATSSGYFVGA